MREVTEFDEGDYSCIASTNRGLLFVRNFTISVSSMLRNSIVHLYYCMNRYKGT